MKPLYHPLQIGSREIPGNVFLAPLAGFTDRPFRELCVNMGASLTYTEMVSVEGILRENKKTLSLMERSENEKLLAIQLFTASPVAAAGAVRIFSRYSPTLIDLNAGCPVPKVTKNGAGSALLMDPETLRKIIKALTNETDIPVTVKIRSGWDKTSINFLETAQASVSGGASAVCLHPRTKTQGYSGTADVTHIRILKENIDVPVIASGDIFSPNDARRVLALTGCDGVMIARGAIGNPFIFNETRHLLETGNPINESLTVTERLETALLHLRRSVFYLGEERSLKEMKKHLCAYTKGIPAGAELRNKIVHAGKCEDFTNFIRNFLITNC